MALSSILISVFALSLPIVMLIATIVFVWMSGRNQINAHRYVRFYASEELLSSDPSKDIDISAYVAKKTSREVIRVVLERYRRGLSELRNAPLETEYLTERILFAYSLIQSSHEAEIISGLQTFDALGTRDLLLAFDGDFERLEEHWRTNTRVSSMFHLVRQNMSKQLNNEQILLISDQAEMSKPYEDSQRPAVKVSY